MFRRTSNPESNVLKKIDKMREPYNTLGRRLHETIMKANPQLTPTLWYGAPAYTKNGEVLCFFRVDDKFMTFGLTEKAKFAPEAGEAQQLMASAWFLTSLNQATEDKLADIVRKATG